MEYMFNGDIYNKCIATLKVSYNQLQWLHHNVTGNEFFRAHKNLQKYYEYIGSILDSVCEYVIGQGYKEPNLEMSIDIYQEKMIADTTAYACYLTANALMSDIFDVLTELYGQVPAYFQSKIDEWLYWLYIEGQYKLGQYLKGGVIK